MIVVMREKNWHCHADVFFAGALFTIVVIADNGILGCILHDIAKESMIFLVIQYC